MAKKSKNREESTSPKNGPTDDVTRESVVDSVKRHPVVAITLHTIAVVIASCALIRAIGAENIAFFGVQSKISDCQARTTELTAKTALLKEQLKDAGCPSLTEVLGRTDFSDLVWRYRREPGPQLASSMKLNADGSVSGYSNPNETNWRITNGHLVFLNDKHTEVTRFRRTRCEATLLSETIPGVNFAHSLQTYLPPSP